MSMNVGDSTDLIHGGGSGLRTFWRSRTDFEKKLLVAMTVMTFVIIGMTVAVIVLAVQNADNDNHRNPKPRHSSRMDMTPAASYTGEEEEEESEEYTERTPMPTRMASAATGEEKVEVPWTDISAITIISTASESDAHHGNHHASTGVPTDLLIMDGTKQTDDESAATLSPSKTTSILDIVWSTATALPAATSMPAAGESSVGTRYQQAENFWEYPRLNKNAPSNEEPYIPRLYPTPA